MRDFKNIDWWLFAFWLALMIYGVLFIFSASTTKIGSEYNFKPYYLKQLLWIFIAIINLFIIIKLPAPLIDLLLYPIYLLTILLLVLVLFLPAINGSHRWIVIGPAQLQPSECAKIVLILIVSKILSKPHITEFQMLYRSLAVIIVPVFLILIEPDLGTTLVFWVSLFAMLLTAGLPLFYLVLIISPILSVITSFYYPAFIVFIILLLAYLYRSKLSWVLVSLAGILNLFTFFLTPVIWNGMKDYQQNRIITFIDPTHDPLGAGYQIIQSKIAVGSGGFLGKGFLLGTQKNMNFIPEHHTDFIFSVIGEETGFWGCLLLLLLYTLLLIRIANSMGKVKIAERKIAISGFLVYLSFQMFINIGMNIGIVPTTGIPLPFISYGGSSLLINSLAITFILKYLHESSA